MKCYKSILKKIWILILILLLETTNLPVISEKTIAFGLNSNSVLANNSLNDEKIVYSAYDLKNSLKNQLEQRKTSFDIRYKADTTNLTATIESTLNEILKTDDYLESCIKSYQCSYSGYQDDVTINFNFSFYTTKAQEEYVDTQVTAILKDIIKVSMSDDQKEKIIHDYIITHVAYDTTLSRFSAYDALKIGSTVCSGYAQLAYKMLNKSGIETKIVVGKGNNNDHAWNLIKLHDVWYHLDCTWDDPLPDVKGRVLYNYYNLNDKIILKDHMFEKLDYPAATKIYVNQPKIIDEKEFVQFTKPYNTTLVTSTKEWKVNFTKEIDELSLKDKIFIRRQGEIIDFPIILQVSQNKKTVQILHNTHFELGKNYTLYICKDINSINGDINLNNSLKMDFTILN